MDRRQRMKRYIIRIAAMFMAAIVAITPVSVDASVMKLGSKGTDVKKVQSTLQSLGYFTYPTLTGYYGSLTKLAVKQFQKDNGIAADGIVGKTTLSILFTGTPTSSSSLKLMALSSVNTNVEYSGDLDWFTQVRDLWKRGMNAVVTDVETGKSFEIKRTYGTNHADVETLTMVDTEIMKEIWGGFSWQRRAVVVKVGNQLIAGSMTAMPHAGLENRPAGVYVSGRSAGYGYGYNYDSIKGNGISGHMDIHFKNSRTHGTNVVQKIHQDMVKKAADYIAQLAAQA
jgi:hypothetical protein